MAELNVQLVAADRAIWSGTARLVIARTLDGDLGVMPGHALLMGELADGIVVIRTVDGPPVVAAVHGGFISVDHDNVSLLAETAELSDEIDVERAREALARAERQNGDGSDALLSEAQRRAETRLLASESHL
ncbi:MAG TPA: F0F1 ATP synthase subunit epsilon [Actinomycetes bacterium]|nr:F0F1 ATP synthase subunit epsilon [Actinomycetes bacterium]